ncbi:hypothetical protein D5086_013435 [Populus alba]|uniref:Uncharacterized protein n=2 Tax=Populus TaxID=3689 RepID=A0ACC4C5S5_POPAL|nr:hypothetical protein NC653_017212 [Populus alba x Populus x berolinensis]
MLGSPRPTLSTWPQVMHTQPSWAWLPGMLDPSQFGSLPSPTLYGFDTLLSRKLRGLNTPLNLELHNPNASQNLTFLEPDVMPHPISVYCLGLDLYPKPNT